MDESSPSRDFAAAPARHHSGNTFSKGDGWCTFAAVAGLVGVGIATDFYHVLDGIPITILALALFFVSLIFFSRRAKWVAHRPQLESLVPMFRAIAVGPLLLALAVVLNGALDRSLVDYHAQVITQKWVSRGRSGPSYHLEFSSWRPDRATERLDVSHSLYGGFEVGDQVTVGVHRGAFHLAWVRSLTR